MPNNSNRRSNEPDRTKRTGTPQARRTKSGNRSKSGNRTAETRKVNPSGQNKRKIKGKKKNGNNHEKLKMALKIAKSSLYLIPFTSRLAKLGIK